MRTFVLFFVLLLAGCVTPQPVDFEKTRTYNKTKDQTWERVVAFFAGNNIQIKTIEKESGVIYAEQSSISADSILVNAADCRTPIGIKVRPNSASFNVLVVTTGTGTQVTVTSEFHSFTAAGYGRLVTHPCASTGLLERTILDSIV